MPVAEIVIQVATSPQFGNPKVDDSFHGILASSGNMSKTDFHRDIGLIRLDSQTQIFNGAGLFTNKTG